MSTPDLPPLPEGEFAVWSESEEIKRMVIVDRHFSAEQMNAYARRALEAVDPAVPASTNLEQLATAPESSALAEFNINEYVWVRLHDRGREIHRAIWEDLMRSIPVGKRRWKYTPPVEVDGWSKWQLWSLMQDFGPHISLGATPPFETYIRFTEPAAAIDAKIKKEGTES